MAVTVVYLDSVFVLNALMDYLLLLGTASLAGVPPRRRRYVLSAIGGGLYAAAVFLPGLGFLASFPVKLMAGVLLAAAAFGGEEHLLRLTLLLFAVACALAGCVLALGLVTGGVPSVNGIFYTDVNAGTLLAAATAAYLVLNVIFHAVARHGVRGELLRAEVCLRGRSVRLAALRDTGTSLTDPVSGQPVLVVSRGTLDPLLPAPVRRLLTEQRLCLPAELLEPLRQAAPDLRFYLLPYRAVGVQGGLLLAVRSEWTTVGGRRYPGLSVALSPTELGTGYHALWGGQVKRRGRYEQDLAASAASDDEAGTFGTGGCALYRGKRHPAAASDERAGSGIAGPSGGGTGPAGAH